MAKKSFIIKTLTAPVVFFLFASTVSGSNLKSGLLSQLSISKIILMKRITSVTASTQSEEVFQKNYMHIHVNPVGVMSSSNTIMMKKGYNLRLSKVNAQR